MEGGGVSVSLGATLAGDAAAAALALLVFFGVPGQTSHLNGLTTGAEARRCAHVDRSLANFARRLGWRLHRGLCAAGGVTGMEKISVWFVMLMAQLNRC
ncbi:hypothetical protein ZWY2020_052881 [Hordeum vulgare]|nr:hypothetical protein ZWY2020_052881 [Hordeum vulgare]